VTDGETDDGPGEGGDDVACGDGVPVDWQLMLSRQTSTTAATKALCRIVYGPGGGFGLKEIWNARSLP
jgi:hypothetical protein